MPIIKSPVNSHFFVTGGEFQREFHAYLREIRAREDFCFVVVGKDIDFTHVDTCHQHRANAGVGEGVVGGGQV